MAGRLIFLSVCVLCLCRIEGSSQILHGRVIDAGSGEALPGAHLIVLPGNAGTTTDEYGRYHLRIADWPVRLVCSFVGYRPDTMSIATLPEGELIWSLHSLTLDEIVVSETALPPMDRIGVIQVPLDQLVKNKFFLGEEDIVRSLAFLPGVSLGNTMRNGLFVRGSDPEHNLFLLDGTPVYNTGHLFGMFSTFNSSTVKGVKMYKGHIPARYGSRLASVVDVTTREGNRKKSSSEYKVGLLSASGLWEGPVGERASVMGAFRASYLGLALLPMRLRFNAGRVDNYLNYWMYDLNLKGNWHPTEKDHFFVSVYHGLDGFPMRNGDHQVVDYQLLRWGNTTTSLRYSRTWSPGLFSRFQVYDAQYNNVVRYTAEEKTGNGKMEATEFLRDRSTVQESGFFNQNDWLISDMLKLHFGYHLQRYMIRPNQIVFKIYDADKAESAASHHAYQPYWESSFFGEAGFVPFHWLDIQAGVRASDYLRAEGKNIRYVEPRLSLGVNISPQDAVQISYFESSQFLHQLTHYTFGAPSDFWVPTTDAMIPQTSKQWSLGYSTTLFYGEYDFSVEAYRKSMKNLVSFREGTEFLFLLNQNWTELVETAGVGRSEGLEWFLHKKSGRLNGWVGYTLSWSRRKFENLNYGRWFFSTYDRRHDLKILANYRFNKEWELSGSWQLQSGHWLTIPVARDYQGLYFTEKNNWTYPAFHQLNLGFTRTRQINERKRTEFSFGLYNVYGRNNPSYFEIDTEWKWGKNKHGDGIITHTAMVMEATSLFNFLPYFSYKVKLE